MDLLASSQVIARIPQVSYLVAFSGCEGKPAFVVAFTRDKKRTIRFEQREVSDPRTAQPESNQNQRPQAASRSQNGGQTSDKKRA